MNESWGFTSSAYCGVLGQRDNLDTPRLDSVANEEISGRADLQVGNIMLLLAGNTII